MQHLKKIILFSTCALFISGCAPGLVVAGGTAISSVVYDKRPMKVIYQDQTIEHLASKALNDTPALEKTKINVNSLNHRVLLTGVTSTSTQRSLAVRLVNHVPNVKRVYNRIRLGQPSMIDFTKDSWLSSKVRLALFDQKNLKSAQVKITVSNGVVYLMGILVPSQQRLATHTARTVTGVKKVVTLYETSK